MAISESNRKIVRTSDEVQYEIESDEPYSLRSGSIGEFVGTRGSIGEFISLVSRRILGSIGQTGAEKANVTFGVALSANGAFFLTQGQADSHVVIELEFSRDKRQDFG